MGRSHLEAGPGPGRQVGAARQVEVEHDPLNDWGIGEDGPMPIVQELPNAG